MADEPLIAGRYRLTERIAAGGMADVWAAEDLRLERTVAVKIVRAPDPEMVARLERESRLLARMLHPGVVRVYDAGSVDDRPFLVMELVDGQPLHARLAADGALDPAEVARIGAAVAGALAHAHELGVVHRDVKPSNVLLDSWGVARLADFGIAQPGDGTRLTQTGMSIGTAVYLAPEQLKGEPVGPSADVYSLGLVLLEALTGVRAFTGPASEAALARLQRDPEIPADLPEPFGELIAQMTRREPDDRPTAAAVAAALGEVGARSTTLVAVDAVGADGDQVHEVERTTGWSRARTAALAGAVGVLAVIALVVAAFPSGGSTPAAPSDRSRSETAPPSVPSSIAPAPDSETTVPPTSTTAPPIPDFAVEEGEQDSSGEDGPDGPGDVTDPTVPVDDEDEVQEPPPTTVTTVPSEMAGSNST